VIAHGGQNNDAARSAAVDFPGTKFVVTQGNVTGQNLASYEVLQEESAFLAGALAGWATTTGIVGHMSGIRVVPGLKGRAAFANGIIHANPATRLLTNFSGNQDDNVLSKRVATAMIDARADIIFTMLNAGRTGAIEACRERGVKQIGNVRDWQQRRNALALQPDGAGLGGLQRTARDRRNVFAALMEAVKTHSLGQISHALYEVGGEYRRNM